MIGTSVGLACRRVGLDVILSDRSAEHVRTASGLGAGRPRQSEDRPQLVVVAVPPDHLGAAIRDALDTSGATVTDVGSIKTEPLRVAAASPAVDRYVGSHPMAGSERSGPLAASAALFDGRPWAITPHDSSAPQGVALVEELARTCGGVPVRMTPEQHDHAVARGHGVLQRVQLLADLGQDAAEGVGVEADDLLPEVGVATGHPRHVAYALA
ncbi:MAG TPA: prephenate dehydrogenase/arogenate dehydrogenase family protein [Nocardioides sp.]|nr:prephenate dehydrogenase/arogenate dehydrogenase family protein [Nocardioides sp.]